MRARAYAPVAAEHAAQQEAGTVAYFRTHALPQISCDRRAPAARLALALAALRCAVEGRGARRAPPPGSPPPRSELTSFCIACSFASDARITFSAAAFPNARAAPPPRPPRHAELRRVRRRLGERVLQAPLRRRHSAAASSAAPFARALRLRRLLRPLLPPPSPAPPPPARPPPPRRRRARRRPPAAASPPPRAAARARARPLLAEPPLHSVWLLTTAHSASRAALPRAAFRPPPASPRLPARRRCAPTCPGGGARCSGGRRPRREARRSGSPPAGARP